MSKELYRAYLPSIIQHSSTHLEKLQLIQNTALRIVLKVPAYMPIARMNDSANQISVKEFLKTAAQVKVRKLYEK